MVLHANAFVSSLGKSAHACIASISRMSPCARAPTWQHACIRRTLPCPSFACGGLQGAGQQPPEVQGRGPVLLGRGAQPLRCPRARGPLPARLPTLWPAQRWGLIDAGHWHALLSWPGGGLFACQQREGGLWWAMGKGTGEQERCGVSFGACGCSFACMQLCMQLCMECVLRPRSWVPSSALHSHGHHVP